MAIILGIDPGSRVTGFGALEWSARGPCLITFGIIRLDSSRSLAERLCELSENLREILTQYRPHHIVIEKVFLGKNADSAFKLGHARGVVMAESARIPEVFIHEYSTREVKRGVAGSGAAEKTQVQVHVQHLLKIQQKIEFIDASDALALALHHGQKCAENAVLRKLQEDQPRKRVKSKEIVL